MIDGPSRDVYACLDGSKYERIIDPYGNTEIRQLSEPYRPIMIDETMIDKAISETTDLSRYLYGTSLRSTITFNDYARVRRNYELGKNLEKEGKFKLNIVSQKSGARTHKVYCDDEADLSIENVLKTLGAMRGRLMLDIMPIRIESIECRVTPEIKNRLLNASKKLKMYGKKPPLVVRFDEWGDRLPDEIRTEDGSGIQLKIVDPALYGKLYFELRATEMMVDTSYNDTIPF